MKQRVFRLRSTTETVFPDTPTSSTGTELSKSEDGIHSVWLVSGPSGSKARPKEAELLSMLESEIPNGADLVTEIRRPEYREAAARAAARLLNPSI
jgi:hypothetical protein